MRQAVELLGRLGGKAEAAKLWKAARVPRSRSQLSRGPELGAGDMDLRVLGIKSPPPCSQFCLSLFPSYSSTTLCTLRCNYAQ